MLHYVPLVSVLVALLLTFVLIHSKAGKIVAGAQIDEGHLISRIGGVGLIGGVLSGWAVVIGVLEWWVIVPLLGFIIVSIFHDIQPLPLGKLFAAYIVAALIFVVGAELFPLNAPLCLLVLLCLIWFPRQISLMGSLDGLVAGLAFCGFTMYGLAELMHGDSLYAMLNFAIAAAAMGFLYHNFYPADILIGAVGAAPLGFLMVAMGVIGWRSNVWPLWFPLLVFSFAISVSCESLIRSLVKGGSGGAQRERYYYERLIQMGIPHRSVLFFQYGLMFASGVSALAALGKSANFIGLTCFIWVAIYFLLIMLIELKWSSCKKKWRQDDLHD